MDGRRREAGEKERENKSASDVSERLSEAQHHAAQGKAFALFIVPSNKYLDHR